MRRWSAAEAAVAIVAASSAPVVVVPGAACSRRGHSFREPVVGRCAEEGTDPQEIVGARWFRVQLGVEVHELTGARPEVARQQI